MTEGKVNLLLQNQWEAEPGEELRIPEAYITGLQYEIIVFGRKKEFTFRCKDYEYQEGNAWRFANVIIDTSKKDPQGNVTLVRLTYHPEIVLINVPFMAIPAPEATDEASQT
jgi:hypothetical protein